MNGTDTAPARRRVSRETRNLLMAACIALVALWVLARLRFPDRPVASIPSVLSQFAPPPGFASLSAEVATARSRLDGLLVALPAPGAGGTVGARAALRIGPGIAITRLPHRESSDPRAPPVLGHDRATGLAIVQVPADPSGALPVPGAASLLQLPRFLVAASASPDGVALAPVFVPGLRARASPAWPAPVWVLPSDTPLRPGALLFTSEGEFVGLGLEDGDRLAVVPGDLVLAEAERLLARGVVAAGDLGLEVQALTEGVAAATGAAHGVVVVHVDPSGPAASGVRPGDVIDGVNHQPVRTLREWEALALRVDAGATVVLDVRRGDAVRPVEIVAASAARSAAHGLGLALRWIPDVGSEVVRVAPESAAAAAGLVPGDLITMAGGASVPTPARVRQLFEAGDESAPLLVAFTRGNAHHVTALPR